MLISKKYLILSIAIIALVFLGGCSDKQVDNTDFEKNYLKELTEENSKQDGSGVMIEPEDVSP